MSQLPSRKLPDDELCRASVLIPGYARCLVKAPYDCKFSMSFGYSFLCKHPEHEKIIEKTIQERKLKK